MKPAKCYNFTSLNLQLIYRLSNFATLLAVLDIYINDGYYYCLAYVTSHFYSV